MPVSNPDTTPIEDKALSKEETIDFLSEESGGEQETLELEKDRKEKIDEKKDKKDEEKGKEGDEEKEEAKVEKSLEDELEEELEVPDEDKLELITPPRRKEILTKYPEIFKEFPGLETSLYRERAYSEIFPTIPDAKEALERAKALDSYEEEIMSGSTESLLTDVRDNDKEAFSKVVDNYLPTLYKVDESAYYHTIGNIIKHTIMTMVKDGRESGAEELIQAADVVNQFIFGTKQFTPPSRLSREEAKADSKETEQDEREMKFLERQFDGALDTITTKTDNILKSTIDKNIDPNESMTDYVRKHAVSEAFDTLEKVMSEDTRFRTILDKLWERAFNDGFSTESMDKIRSAYLSKARTLLPAIIKKSRNDALKGLGKRVREEDDTDRKDKKGPLPVGRERSHSTSPQSGKTDRDKARAIPKGTRTLDYLMQD